MKKTLILLGFLVAPTLSYAAVQLSKPSDLATIAVLQAQLKVANERIASLTEKVNSCRSAAADKASVTVKSESTTASTTPREAKLLELKQKMAALQLKFANDKAAVSGRGLTTIGTDQVIKALSSEFYAQYDKLQAEYNVTFYSN